MNQRPGIADQPSAIEWLAADDAATLLGIKRETLYAYVSRGLVRSEHARGGDRTRLYLREDLERLRARSLARSGHAAVAAGALRLGEPVLETRIGTIKETGPWYRGHSAIDLARDEKKSFEEVASLLWEGPFPAGPVLRRTGGLGVPAPRIRALLEDGADPFDAMMITCGALAALEPRAEGSAELARGRAPSLVRRLIASAGLAISVDAVTASLEADSAARALLVALGGRTTAPAIAAMNEALVLAADHELNASTFAVRVAASSGASLGAAILAGFATLSGPRHGAATARVEAFAAEVGKPERASAVVAEHLERGETVPGFGHPLYPKGDPRGARLLEKALEIGARNKGVKIVTSVATAMELAARERPTIDVGLVALANALGLRRGAAIAIFASGRIAGWVAHALEQRDANYLLRPRARYVGP